MSLRRISIVVAVVSILFAVSGVGAEIRVTEEGILTGGAVVDEIVFPYPASSWDPVRFEAGNLLIRTWRDLGLSVEALPMNYSGVFSLISEAPHDDYNAWVFGYVSRPERLDPDVLLYRPFHTTGQNFQRFSYELYDEVVEAQRQEVDLEKRRELVYQAQEILNEQVPAIPLYHVTSIVAHSQGRFEGWTPMVGYNLFNEWNLLNLRPLTFDNTVKFARVSPLTSSNPLNFAGGHNPDIMKLIYDSLARIAPNGQPVPWAAESWEWLDNRTLLVNLRQGMVFHDGKPVTAEDVKFSYEYIDRWGVPELVPFTSVFTDIQVLDDHTLKMTMETSYPGVLQTTFSKVYILPKHIWEDVVQREGLDTPLKWNNPNPIGSGPFKWGFWRPQEELYLEPFEGHWQPPQVNFRFIPFANPEALWFAVQSGDVDYHERRLLPGQIDEAKQIRELGLSTKPDFGVYYLGFNLQILPFADFKFRQALAYAIDYDFIVDVILQGYGQRGESFIAPANEFWHNPNLDLREFDLERTRQILEEAGYTWDSRGRLHYPELIPRERLAASSLGN